MNQVKPVRQVTYDNSIDSDAYTESVNGYINKCIKDVTEVKALNMCANQKPWLTGEVHMLSKFEKCCFKIQRQCSI